MCKVTHPPAAASDVPRAGQSCPPPQTRLPLAKMRHPTASASLVVTSASPAGPPVSGQGGWPVSMPPWTFHNTERLRRCADLGELQAKPGLARGPSSCEQYKYTHKVQSVSRNTSQDRARGPRGDSSRVLLWPPQPELGTGGTGDEPRAAFGAVSSATQLPARQQHWPGAPSHLIKLLTISRIWALSLP